MLNTSIFLIPKHHVVASLGRSITLDSYIKTETNKKDGHGNRIKYICSIKSLQKLIAGVRANLKPILPLRQR